MEYLAMLVCVVAATNAVAYDDAKEEWGMFKMHNIKYYAEETEEDFRMRIYAENMRKIAEHNKRFEQGLETYSVAPNKYSDMLHEEFVRAVNGFNKTLRNKNISGSNRRDGLGATFIPPANMNLPSQIDWREKGAVTEVKEQGLCGSCWAFSATGALEAQHFIKTGKLVSLSEQNLIDCTKKYGNFGCSGGYMGNAFQYVKDNHGINTEASYPYEGVDHTDCRYNPNNSGAVDIGFVDMPQGDEDMLMAAVATVGPVCVSIDATVEFLQFYNEGVFYDKKCSPKNINHAVLVVGYGTDEKAGDYWLVKNSWGKTWGDHGYIKMARNKDNHCGIASFASYPLV